MAIACMVACASGGIGFASRAGMYELRGKRRRVVPSREFDIGDRFPPLMDSDGDGLADLVEYAIGTDPDSPDTDGNGLSDGVELSGMFR